MSELPDGARKVIYDYVTKAIQVAATKYAAVHGKPMDERLVKFLCVFVTETVNFIWESAEKPEKLNARAVALVVIKRTNAAVGLIDESDPQVQALVDCGVAAVSLALTLADTAELEATLTEAVTVATAASGGVAAPGYAGTLVVGVMGALYAMYEAYEAIEACEPLLETPEGQAIPQTVEGTFPASDKVPETRAYCIEQADDLVCSPDHPDPPQDGATPDPFSSTSSSSQPADGPATAQAQSEAISSNASSQTSSSGSFDSASTSPPSSSDDGSNGTGPATSSSSSDDDAATKPED